MTAKEKLVPELRFPEFTDEWEKKKLEEIGIFYSGKGLAKKDIIKDGKNGCILYGELFTKYKEVIENVKSFTDVIPKNAIFSKKMDLLFPTSTTANAVSLINPSVILRDNVIVGGDISILRPFRKEVNTLMLSYMINGVLREKIAKFAEGITIFHIYGSELKKIEINLPSIAEQQKIGDFLYTIDQKLELQRKKIEELKNYKKGMMQRIFNQEIRFKDEDGNEYPEWEEKRLGEITEVITSNIRISDLKENGRTPVYDVLQMAGYTDEIGLDSDYISIIKDGSGVGRVKILPKDSLFIATMNGIKVKDENLYFVYLIIKNINFSKYIVGSGIPHIYYKDYSNEKIQLPSISEQEKIAKFLSHINEKVKLEEEKLRVFQEYKKGLIQRMFI